MRDLNVWIGTAGWSIPKPQQARFPEAGSHLARYSQSLTAVEINSSFYRSHRPATYERWASTVPDGFRFAVKVPQAITHDRQLQGALDELRKFLAEITPLGEKLGPLLVQLPPSLQFNRKVAGTFFRQFRGNFQGDIVCEPRHPSWTEPAAVELCGSLQIARVWADPPVISQTEGQLQQELIYYRLHGSPRIYYSEYSPEYLRKLAAQIGLHQNAGRRVWVIFDNTASGAATGNALDLKSEVCWMP